MSTNPNTEVGLKLILSKTRLANVAAFIIVVGGFAYAAWQKDTELMKILALIGFGYLFGKST